MNLTTTTLPLTGFGTPPSHATVEIGSLTAAERFRRAAKAPALGLAISVAVLPIPIVHFAVPPAALLTGIALGIRRMGQRQIITSAEGSCPFCGTSQTLGLTGSSYRMPRNLKCHACLKPFTISAD
jgi:hypothetical protein